MSCIRNCLNQKLAKLLLGLGVIGLVSCQTVDRPNSHATNLIQIPENIDTEVLVKDTLPQVDTRVDSDGDGVEDALDQCPKTPLNMVIDEQGCPFQPIGTGLRMEYRAFYETNESELTNQYALELEKIAQKMHEYENAEISIESHISTYESRTNKVSLAQARADYVKNYLILVYGIDPARIKINAYGAERPIAPEDTKEGQRLNQRVFGVVSAEEDK